MLRGIVARLASAVRSDGEEVDASDDESGFARSQLDASVLYAHGSDVGRLEREIADVEEQAREIDRQVSETEAARRDR